VKSFDFAQTGRVSFFETTIRDLGAKNVLFAPFIYKNDPFTKTGSGQT
jgi:hypothetical protein